MSIIWYFDASGIARTVRVGAGCIRERLEAARRDLRFNGMLGAAYMRHGHWCASVTGKVLRLR